jgi:hypothetical protein
LLSKSTLYHNWHHNPHHQRVHFGALAIYVLLITSILFQSFFGGSTNAYAAANTWTFGNSSDYTYNSSNLEIVSNSARHKLQQLSDDDNTNALWHFDETEGTSATDSSGNSNTATLGSGASFASGKAGNGTSFTGSGLGSVATVADSSTTSLSGAMTLEAYVKFNSAFDSTQSVPASVFDKGNYKLYFDDTDGKLKFDLTPNTAKSWSKLAEGVGNGDWSDHGTNYVSSTVVWNNELYAGLVGAAGAGEVWKYSGSGSSWTKIGGDGVRSSWNGADYEGVYGLAVYNNELYSGLGSSSYDGEVWKYDGTSWTKIGGDGQNSSWSSASNSYYLVRDLVVYANTLCASIYSAYAGDAEVWSYDGSSWTKIGGDGVGSSWATSYESVWSLATNGSTTLYAGLGASAGDAEVWGYDGTTWTKIGGDAANSSWADATYEQITSLAYIGTTLYAGLSTSGNDAEVWIYDGTTWTKIGGDSINSGWTTNYESVYAITALGSSVVVGLGDSSGDAEVWSWSGSAWTKIGGDNTNSGWTGIENRVYSMSVIGTDLYAGLGGDVNEGTVWKWNGSSWAAIGGRDTNSWFAPQLVEIDAITVGNGKLYAGSGIWGNGSASKQASVWQYDGTSWSMIGGGGINGGWDETIDAISSLQEMGGALYVGTSGTAGQDAEVWSWNGSAWTKVGGDGANSSWNAGTYGNVKTLANFQGSLYAGVGGISSGDGEVWSWNGSAWTKVGGDGANSSWNTTLYVVNAVTDNQFLYVALYGSGGTSYTDAEVWRYNGSAWEMIGGRSAYKSWGPGYESDVMSSANYNNKQYFGLHGTSPGDAVVYEYDGSTGAWTPIGGNGTNSSWAGATYESVYSLYADATYLYAGLGQTSGDAEVWRYNGTSWAKIGGDGLNSGWSTGYEYVISMVGDGTNLYAGLGTGSGDGEVWSWSGSAWTKIGGDNTNSGWNSGYDSVSSMNYFGGNLYAGLGTSSGEAEVWKWSGSTWSKIGGDTVNSSWADSTYETVFSMTSDATYLYAGLGDGAGDAEVWRYNGSTWSKIGGDTVNSSWADTTYERARSLASDGTNLYAGLGYSTGEAELWKWDGSTWSKIGGDTVNSSWADATYEIIDTILVSGSNVLVGLGSAYTTDPEVWKWNGSTWTKLGGDGLNDTWSDGPHEGVASLAINQGVLYAGLGWGSAGEAEVWSWNGSAWAKIGGDGLNNSWNTDYEKVSSLVSYNGELYAGLGSSAGDAEIWKYDGSSWTKVGGDTVGVSWVTGNYEDVQSMTVYNGKLIAGLGTGAGDGEIWSYGDNKIAASSRSSWDAGWYHIAATYDGATAKIYVDGLEDSATAFGSVTLADSAYSLYIGGAQGTTGAGLTLGKLAGMIDEVRISNTARTSFTTSPYTNSAQTIQPTSAVDDSDVGAWSGFVAEETLNGGTITYRLSDDNGTSWKYWNSSAWVASNSLANANSEADIHANIATFSVSNVGLLWQAILTGSGSQQVVLSSVEVQYTADTTNPTNPASLTAINADGGSTELTSGNWYNYAAPKFTWGDGSDAGSGIEGYWVYFGTSDSADPRTTRGIATEVGGTGIHFQSGTAIIIGTDTAAIANGTTYYLRVLAKDRAENYPESAYAAFTYKYDAAAPTPPSIVSASPSGFTTSTTFTFLWPNGGSSAATDPGAPTTGSSIAGYQYKTGASSGSYSNWSSTTTETQVALSGAAYQSGVNTFYLRVVDNAGNTSSEASVSYYYAGEGASAPTAVSALPASSEGAPLLANDVSFQWAIPQTYSGSIKRYRYSINALPTATNTTVTTATSLATDAYATQQGKNTFYVVAEDETEQINYNLYGSVDFYVSTTAPGIPTSILLTDSSSRATSEYRLTLTWSAPSSGGDVSQYIVHRSTDGTSFSSVGSVASTGYIDSDLSSETTYYYKIYAKDSAGAVSADPGAGGIVSKQPTGKYTAPPTIDADSVEAVAGATSAEITWTTDRKSDAFVEYGTTTSYGLSLGAREEKTDHSVKITGLAPGTLYHFKTQSLDPGDLRDYSQSLGYSADYTFTTTAAPALANVIFSDTSTNSTILSFDTNKASSSTIEYGATTDYGQTIKDDSGGGTTKHVVRMSDLQDGTTYQVKVTIRDADNNEVVSPGHAFTTIAQPRISDLRFETANEEALTSIKVGWKTNVPASSAVTYVSDKAEKKESATSQFVTDHEIVIRGLVDQQTYQLQAISRDQFGNQATSDVNTFKTPLDSRPPKINNMTTEVKASGISDAQKAQIIVTWETDEPATSQIEYGPGISGKDYPNKTKEDMAYSTSHVVIVSELDPSKIYHLRAVSHDNAGNLGASEDTTTITGKVQKSVIDIILNSLQRSLGWIFGAFGTKLQ